MAREDLVEASKVVGFSKDIRVVEGEAAEEGGGDGDQDRHLDIIWRFMYKTTIPRDLSHEMNGKSSRSRFTIESL